MVKYIRLLSVRKQVVRARRESEPTIARAPTASVARPLAEVRYVSTINMSLHRTNCY